MFDYDVSGRNNRDDKRRELHDLKIIGLNYFNWKSQTASARRWASCTRGAYDYRSGGASTSGDDASREFAQRVLQTRRWRPWSVAHAQGKPKTTRIECWLAGEILKWRCRGRRRKVRPDETGWRTRTTTVEERLQGEGMPVASRGTEENARTPLAWAAEEKFEERGEEYLRGVWRHGNLGSFSLFLNVIARARRISQYFSHGFFSSSRCSPPPELCRSAFDN